MAESNLLNHWYLALTKPVGLSISTNDRGLLQQQLYRCRAEANDEKLAELSIILPNNQKELWIVWRAK